MDWALDVVLVRDRLVVVMREPPFSDDEVPLVAWSVGWVVRYGGAVLVVSNVVNEEVAVVPWVGCTGPSVTSETAVRATDEAILGVTLVNWAISEDASEMDIRVW